MKYKTTAKAIREGACNPRAAGYCDIQNLLINHSPIAYTCGVYGWNFDVYEVYGVTITVKMSGEKTPLSFIQTVSQSAYLAALRDAAFYLLDKASTLDTEKPYNTRAQIVKMFEEHRGFNEKELV